jgi:HK97 gp10 family phage protein
MPTIRRAGDSKFYAIIEGGPQLARALSALDRKVRQDVAKEALTEGGRIIADAWANMAPVGSPPEDEHPGAYRRSLSDNASVTARSSASGATAAIRPAVLSDLPDDQQPRLYAARLEFGDADRDAEPSARPAFDAAQRPALAAISERLTRAFR